MTRIRELLKPLCEDVTLVQGDTRETLVDTPYLSSAALVYIDGGHSYPCVSSDWKLVKTQCPPGCIVVFDDVGWEGVAQTIQEAEAEGYLFLEMDKWRKHTILF